MLKAKDIMTSGALTLEPDTDVATAAKLMLEKHLNGLPVVDRSGKLIGVLCQSDLVAQQKTISMPSLFTILDGFISFSSNEDLEKEVNKIAATKVEHAMTPDPITIEPDTSIEKIADLMVERKFYTLPVVENGKLVGVVGKEDVLKVLAK
ncbi:CBS domain-containing protein [Maridesulfovibrio salexigens]|uniref:CBS domain containing membrane protein n=1 Tax=Maridesulfovibrio salexigens (strain ATCC 14822 / DSM 2638 / NCIMB 8403 / VKM B-1763) TaxID=526222 RepID=C6BV80_MARSD|nr:CBS domain-containing protein [Maridesulfovibrio salexigens]ACS80055.1 CBS domain containing membrane protein [Maridesulfovibrio salexigens DSM 2638]